MICPNCNKLISVSEERCPFCGAWRPGLFGYAPALQKLFGGYFDFPHIVTLACVALFGFALLLEPQAIFHPPSLFAILSPGERALLQTGATSRELMYAGWWWTLLTATFVHGGLLHIFFNMVSLRNLGPPIVRVFGSARGFVIFMIASAVGFLASNIVLGAFTIGASGGIFGLLAALIVYGRRVGHVALTNQLWTSAIMMFVMSFLIANVNNVAHVGGFAGGWVAASAMRLADERRESTGVQVLAGLLVVATLAGLVLSFLRASSVVFRG